MMNYKKPSSITDIPLKNVSDEALDIEDYSKALIDFIIDCATPLTIGIQGEWGSGKSSLMYLIKNELKKNNIATAWVNTWEYSLFRKSDEAIPIILKGLLDNLKKEWQYKLPKTFSDKYEKATNFFKGLGKIAIDAVAAKGIGVKDFTDKVAVQTDSVHRVEIAEIRETIQDILNEIVGDRKNPVYKIVFFIDDLDRIEPSLAVQILEALKNIFDIENCVFILAIDYEVVVKGLKSKFGEKTLENEREFRSFFDKIIQVPFAMPVSMYNIEKLLNDRFNALGFEMSQNIKSGYTDIVKFTVGSNPRSIKRYINTYSLLKRLFDRKIDKDISSKNDNEIKNFALFALVGIQIAFPRIYNLILNDEDFVNWDDKFAQRYLGNDAPEIPEEFKQNELFDEKWEQIIWAFCQKDPYLKVKTNKILVALNKIREVLTDENLGSIISDVLEFTNITSVGDDPEAGEKIKKIRLSGWEEYYRNRIESGSPKDTLELLKYIHDYIVNEYTLDKIIIQYTPRDLSFQANIHAKTRVFLYCRPQKVGIAISSGDFNKKIYNTSDFDDECKTKVRDRYEYVLKKAKK